MNNLLCLIIDLKWIRVDRRTTFLNMTVAPSISAGFCIQMAQYYFCYWFYIIIYDKSYTNAQVRWNPICMVARTFILLYENLAFINFFYDVLTFTITSPLLSVNCHTNDICWSQRLLHIHCTCKSLRFCKIGNES